MNFFKFVSWNKANVSRKECNKDKNMECFCKDYDGFFITRRQASTISSIIIFILTLVFIFGYLWGQRKTIQEFTSKIVEDSFADQVNYSLYTRYRESDSNIEGDDIIGQGEESKELPEIKENNNNQVKVVNEINKKQANLLGEDLNKVTSVKHYAVLIGFGSKKFAEQFINKMQKKGYNVYITQRISKTSKGKVITWYQVLTDKFDDRSKLIDYVNNIRLTEKLNDIKLITTN